MTRQTDLFMLLLNVQKNQHFAINMGKFIFLVLCIDNYMVLL